MSRIFRSSVEQLQDEIEKINKKADKWGLPHVELILGEETTTVIHDDINPLVKKVYHYQDVQVICKELIKIQGWTFISKLEHLKSGEQTANLLKEFGKVPTPVQFRTAEPICEHCKKDRYRRDTFVLFNESTNEFKQVGRNCLHDFLGYDPEFLLAYFEKLTTLQGQLINPDGEYCGSHGFNGEPNLLTEDYLKTVAAVIRQKGWVSGAQAYEDQSKTSTASYSWDIMMDHLAWRDSEIKITGFDEQLATNALAWIHQMEVTESDNNYLWNLKLAASLDLVDSKTRGIIASLIVTYQKQVAREQKPKVVSEYVGEVGKREEFDLTLMRTISVPSDFGVTEIHILKDDNGNVVKWFSSSSVQLREGDRYRLKGTVKAHEEYKGEKNTILSRCKLVEVRS